MKKILMLLVLLLLLVACSSTSGGASINLGQNQSEPEKNKIIQEGIPVPMFSKPIDFDKDFYITDENDEVIFYENGYILKIFDDGDDRVIGTQELIEKNDDYYVINSKGYKNWIKTLDDLTTYYADSTYESERYEYVYGSENWTTIINSFSYEKGEIVDGSWKKKENFFVQDNYYNADENQYERDMANALDNCDKYDLATFEKMPIVPKEQFTEIKLNKLIENQYLIVDNDFVKEYSTNPITLNYSKELKKYFIDILVMNKKYLGDLDENNRVIHLEEDNCIIDYDYQEDCVVATYNENGNITEYKYDYNRNLITE